MNIFNLVLCCGILIGSILKFWIVVVVKVKVLFRGICICFVVELVFSIFGVNCIVNVLYFVWCLLSICCVFLISNVLYVDKFICVIFGYLYIK